MIQPIVRFLQNTNTTTNTNMENNNNDNDMLRNQILYIVYLCVLGCCCITPCIYYIRISAWQRRQIREYQDMERRAIIVALAQSTNNATSTNNHINGTISSSSSSASHIHRSMEATVIRAERGARILQLMEPVRMVLKEEHFIRRNHDLTQQPVSSHDTDSNIDNDDDDYIVSEYEDDIIIKSNHKQLEPDGISSSDLKNYDTNVQLDGNTHDIPSNMNLSRNDDTVNITSITTPDKNMDDDGEEESMMIKIPRPGLIVQNIILPDSTMDIHVSARVDTSRIISGVCTICLSGYEVGQNIVWSSNTKCHHCFHTSCMEQWLTKQQHGAADGPICPCCRRDFIIDPYDVILSTTPTTPTIDTNHTTIPTTTTTSSSSSNSNPTLIVPYGDSETCSGVIQ